MTSNPYAICVYSYFLHSKLTLPPFLATDPISDGLPPAQRRRALVVIVLSLTMAVLDGTIAVSYTHLDVYKRQTTNTVLRPNLGSASSVKRCSSQASIVRPEYRFGVWWSCYQIC